MTPTRWLELRVRVPTDAARPAVAEALIELGGTAVEEDGDTIATFIAPPDDAERFVREAAEHLRAAVGGEPELTWRWRPHEDWEERWRRGLRPRRVGRRFVVTPSWAEPERRPRDVVLTIDPSMAFGTGEHATTRGALRLLEEAVRPGDRVLDMGTGTGILAVAAAKLGAKHVLAVDRDEDALANARENVDRNGAAETVELLHGSVDRPFLVVLGPGRFDLIAANVLTTVLEPLLPAFRASLDTGGRLVLGGILGRESDGVIESARAAGLRLRTEDLEDEWWSGLFERLGTPE